MTCLEFKLLLDAENVNTDSIQLLNARPGLCLADLFIRRAENIVVSSFVFNAMVYVVVRQENCAEWPL
jgi:hypothetical protein